LAFLKIKCRNGKPEGEARVQPLDDNVRLNEFFNDKIKKKTMI